MRKVLLIAGAGLCIICAAMASTGNINSRAAWKLSLQDSTPNDTSKKLFGYMPSATADTTPKDTSKIRFGYAVSAYADTTPADTSKKSFVCLR
ncbi:MAG TPA: hypothetical protein VG890_12860 [Puia sp.]|nr:hypothetical protein [Puia sp.]